MPWKRLISLTISQLRRDAPQGSSLPTFLTNSSTYDPSLPLSNQTISWDAIPADSSDGWDGFALLIDDVERFTGNALNFSLASLQEGIPHFFRLAVSVLRLGVLHYPFLKCFTSFRDPVAAVTSAKQRRSGLMVPGLILYRALLSIIF